MLGVQPSVNTPRFEGSLICALALDSFDQKREAKFPDYWLLLYELFAPSNLDVMKKGRQEKVSTDILMMTKHAQEAASVHIGFDANAVYAE